MDAYYLICPPNDWPGQNRLGILHMEMRDSINKNEQSSSQSTTDIHSGETSIREGNGDVSFSVLAHAIDAAAQAVGIGCSTPIKDNITDQTTEDDNDKGKTVILGDSIIKGTPSPEGIKINANSGACLHEISSLIDNAKPTINLTEADNVVIALGVNDLKETESVGSCTIRFTKAIDTVKSQAPKAKLFVSAILPKKKSKGNTNNFNEKVADMNSFIKQYADDKDNNVTFIGNSNSFKETNHKGYYQKGDVSGLHLYRPGQIQLVDIIKEAVEKHTASTKKKRGRNTMDTPPSAQKDTKTMKLEDTVDSGSNGVGTNV